MVPRARKAGAGIKIVNDVERWFPRVAGRWAEHHTVPANGYDDHKTAKAAARLIRGETSVCANDPAGG
jgi:hypothetical protein